MNRQPPYDCDPNSELILLEWLSNNHNGGDLAFGPDGYLYIPAGDGAMDSDTNLTGLPGSYDRDPKGQDLSNLPATIMRIDVDRPEAERPYSIPSDNPFIHLEGARPEIWVYGIRNPWRITFDRETGHLWAGNVGQDRWEMIHLVRRGDNYGWSLYEGSHPFFLNRKQGPTPIVEPTVEHPHSEARSITGALSITARSSRSCGVLTSTATTQPEKCGHCGTTGETYLASGNRRYNATDREFRR